MSTSKAKSKRRTPPTSTAKRGASSAPSAPDGPAATASAERDEQVSFDRARETFAEPEALDVEAFELLLSDAAAAEVGGTTKGVDVLREVRRALLSGVDTVRTHGVALRYPPARMRYTMDLLHALERQVHKQSSGAQKARGRSSRVTRAESDALAARKTLIDALEPVASADPEEATAFAVARGNLSAGTDLLASLQSLTEVAARWRTHKRPALARLAKHQGITEALLAESVRSAEALARARDDLAAGTEISGRDAPATNVLEGRVIFETGRLYDAIERNRTSTEIALPKLGPTLLRALAWDRSRADKNAKDAAKEKGKAGPAAEPKKEPKESDAKKDAAATPKG